MATPLGVELLAIVTGPLRLLEEKPKPIKPSELERAAAFEKGVERAMRDFIEQTEPGEQGEEPEEFDYFATLAKVSKKRELKEEIERASAVCVELPQPMLAGEYLTQFIKGRSFLELVIPRRGIVTLTGPKAVEPSGCELSAFWRAWEAVEDPRVLLRDLREGILVSDQVEVARQIYPSAYATMTLAMLKAIAEAKGKAKDKDWEPATWQEQQIETLLQISRLSPELAAELQARARQAEMQERNEEQGGSSKTKMLGDKPADSHQTPVQRVANR